MIGENKEPLSWKPIPFIGLATFLLAQVKEKGFLVLVRVKNSSGRTTINTVFDWDKPEYDDVLTHAKDTKAGVRKDNVGAKDSGT